MIARRLRHVSGAALAVLLLLGLASTGLTQTGALSQKATEAAEITAIAQQNGHVRVIVMFDSPVPANQLKSDPTSVANVKARVAAAQDAIVATHFGSATSPTQGQGFDRGLTRFPITPGFAVNVSPSELQALANDPRVTRINYDRVLRPSLIDSVPLIGMTTAYTLNATGAGQAVAVLDTGVKSDHEFLAGKVVAEACFSNAFPGTGRVSLCPNGTQSQTGVGAANADTVACINGSDESLRPRQPRCRHRRRPEHQPARRRAAERSGQERARSSPSRSSPASTPLVIALPTRRPASGAGLPIRCSPWTTCSPTSTWAAAPWSRPST